MIARVGALAAACAVVVAACGPDVVEGETICEQTPPVRVLATSEGDEASLVGLLGDRLWFQALHYREGRPYEGGVVEWPLVVSVSTCGAEPRTMGSASIEFLDPVDDVAVLSRYPGGLEAFDPQRETSTHLLDDVGDRSSITAHGIVATDSDGAVWLSRRPLGHRSPQQIGRDVMPDTSDLLLGDGAFWVGDDEMRYLDTQQQVWRVELESGAATLEHTGVTSFFTAEDGSFVAFLSSNGHAGVIVRSTGEVRVIAPATTCFATGRWVAFADDAGAFVHDVATATTYSLGGPSLPFALDDDRLFLYGFAEIFTPATGSRTRLDLPLEPVPSFVQGEFWHLEWHEAERDRVLWRVPSDGSPRVFVADRVSDWRPLDDEALLLWRITDDGDRALDVWRPNAPALLRIDVGVPKRIDSDAFFELTGESELLYAIATPGRAGWWRTLIPAS